MPRHGCPDDERVADVVAVAHPRHREAGQVLEPLAHGQQIGQRLDRVALVGQQVDHRDVDGPRHPPQRVVGKHARADDSVVARQRAGQVLRGLPLGQADLVAPDRHGMAPELDHRHLHGVARPGRRLLEHEPDPLAAEQLRHLPALGPVEQVDQLLRGDVVDVEKVARHWPTAPPVIGAPSLDAAPVQSDRPLRRSLGGLIEDAEGLVDLLVADQ